MKIKIKGIVIRPAKEILAEINRIDSKAENAETVELATFLYLHGLYASRIFGLCVYRLKYKIRGKIVNQKEKL